jgi:hypothetical protein
MSHPLETRKSLALEILNQRLKRVPDEIAGVVPYLHDYEAYPPRIGLHIEHVRDEMGITLPGRLLLETCHSLFKDKILYHGSYRSPSEMEGNALVPKQARWQDTDGNFYTHGDPAIAAADNFELPLIKSLLHDNHPALKDKKGFLILVRRMDSRGNTLWFTSKEAIDALTETKAEGHVYLIGKKYKNPQYERKYFDRVLSHSLDEYRITEPIPLRMTTEIKTTVDDLPSNLLVIDAPRDVASRMLDRLPKSNIMALSQQTGIKVRPLRGDLSHELFPNLEGR